LHGYPNTQEKGSEAQKVNTLYITFHSTIYKLLFVVLWISRWCTVDLFTSGFKRQQFAFTYILFL